MGIIPADIQPPSPAHGCLAVRSWPSGLVVQALTLEGRGESENTGQAFFNDMVTVVSLESGRM